MPVNSPHLDYAARQLQWKRCRDCFEGSDKVKEATTEYLPLLEGIKSSEDPSYKRYLKRAMFYPATERTVTGLIGMALRKPAELKVPSEVEDDLEDLTLAGDQFVDVAMRLLVDDLVVGRAGILVDWSDAEDRPFWNVYCAEQIVNWRESIENGQRVLTQVVLREEYDEYSNDPFVAKCEIQYRVLQLITTTPTTNDPIDQPHRAYVSTIFRKASGDKDAEWLPQVREVPLRRNKPLPFIPFVFLGPRTASSRVEKPPLLDLVDLNLSHYRSSADLEHGRHYTALPTPWITGWVPDVNPATGEAIGFAIGSGIAWTIPKPDAKVGMLEFTGDGLGTLERALEQKEKAMAVVGARLLESTPEVQETASAVRMRHGGEVAVLTTIVKAASAALSKALQYHVWWTGRDDVKQVEAELNTDFFATKLTAQEVDSLVKTWQAGGISYETLYWNLQQGEWARPNVSWEEEKDSIAAEEPEDEPPPVDPMAAALANVGGVPQRAPTPPPTNPTPPRRVN